MTENERQMIELTGSEGEKGGQVTDGGRNRLIERQIDKETEDRN